MDTINDSELVTHKQLRRWVADRLRADILEGRLRPGEWLRQERLAQEYGVSQMPVREALKELVAEGLVEHVPYRGVRIVTFTVADVEDLYAIRSDLEGRAARATALRITPEELAELKVMYEQMKLCQSPDDLRRYREVNRRFHLYIIAASKRPYLIRTLTQMWDVFPTMLWSNFAVTAARSLPARDQMDWQEHEAILQALERHDGEGAEVLMRRHIQTAGNELIAFLRENS
ncbi:MAG: GntR family transcriptional regulator [Anaerolinea sp.]|nr:GntR family transcriptional regulator [Anaerolinea sp.]